MLLYNESKIEPRVGHDGINKKCPIVGDLIPMSFPGSKDVVDHTVENPTHQVSPWVCGLAVLVAGVMW